MFARASAAVALAALSLPALGCLHEPTLSQSSLSQNALSFNALSFNALSFNALSFNALSFNALTANALTANALTANALTASAMEDPLAREPRYFDQIPELHGPAGIESLAVLRQGLVGQPGETVAIPDRTAIPAQIDPGLDDYVLYTLTDDGGNQLGQVLITATANAALGFLANYEYWYLTTNLSNSSAVTFTGGSSMPWNSPPSGLGVLSFATARSSAWSSGNMIGNLLLNHNPLTGTVVGLNWAITYSGGIWGGQMNWYHNTATNVLGPSTTWRLAPGSYNSPEYYIISTPST
jgi:hypothetical protein